MSENINKLFGDNIRTLRIRCGLSQADVGAAMGYTHSHICKIESGKCTISAEQMLNFSTLFHLPVSLFFDDEKRPEVAELTKMRCCRKLCQLSERDLRLVQSLIDQMLVEQTAE